MRGRPHAENVLFLWSERSGLSLPALCIIADPPVCFAGLAHSSTSYLVNYIVVHP